MNVQVEITKQEESLLLVQNLKKSIQLIYGEKKKGSVDMIQ